MCILAVQSQPHKKSVFIRVCALKKKKRKKKVLNVCLCPQHKGSGVVYLGQTPPASAGDLIVSEVPGRQRAVRVTCVRKTTKTWRMCVICCFKKGPYSSWKDRGQASARLKHIYVGRLLLGLQMGQLGDCFFWGGGASETFTTTWSTLI